MKYTPRLKKYYLDTIVPKLTEQFKYTTVMQVPKVLKVCINQGVGEATQDRKSVDIACAEISLITGQKAVPTKSKKAISNFKLREDMAIGARVTLRGDRMYEFLDRLIAVALPRVRDFRGINDKSFDGRGNFTLGVTEQIIFPEIDLDKISKISGMDISIITSARTDKEAHALLSSLGFKGLNLHQ